MLYGQTKCGLATGYGAKHYMNNASEFYKLLVAEYQSVYGSTDVDFPNSALERAKFDKVLTRALDKGAVTEKDTARLALYRTILGYTYKVKVAPSKTQINEAKKAFLNVIKAVASTLSTYPGKLGTAALVISILLGVTTQQTNTPHAESSSLPGTSVLGEL